MLGPNYYFIYHGVSAEKGPFTNGSTKHLRLQIGASLICNKYRSLNPTPPLPQNEKKIILEPKIVSSSFWPFEGVAQGNSTSNCNISQMPYFDQTLKISSWDHLYRMPTVTVTSVHASYMS